MHLHLLLLLRLHQELQPSVPIKVGHPKVSRWKQGFGNRSRLKQDRWHQQRKLLRQQQLTAGIHQFKTDLKKQPLLQQLQQGHQLTAGMCQFKHAVLALSYPLPKRYRRLVLQAYQLIKSLRKWVLSSVAVPQRIAAGMYQFRHAMPPRCQQPHQHQQQYQRLFHLVFQSIKL